MVIHRNNKYLILLLLLIFSFESQVLAATISQGYPASQTLSAGTMVSRSVKNNNIVAAQLDNQASLLGVVVASKDSSLAIGSAPTQTQVVTTGTTNTFVTDLAGQINRGDPVTISPINGVGMKATKNGEIIGYAEDSTIAGKGKPVTVQSSNLSTHHTTIQSIPVAIGVKDYIPILSDSIPQPLQNLANSLTGRPVSIIRLAISIFTLIFAALIVIIIIYSGIHNSFTAIGRNPLAKHAINQALFRSIIAATIIVGFSLTFAYVILIT